MKTVKFSLLAIALIGGLTTFSSCESKSGKRVKEKVEEISTKTDTLLFSPEKIGVTKLIKEFIPYPKFDGGTGMRASFFVGIQYKEKTYEIECSGLKFFRKNITEEQAENDSSISSLVLAHYLASNTPKDYIDVLAVKGEVVKITRRATFFPDSTFYPAEVIWAKK